MNSSISKLSKTLIVTPIIATAVLTFVPTLSAFAATQTPNNYICTFKKDASYIYWTPIILLNSPYGGSSSASATQGYTGEYSIGGVTSSTTQQVGWQMSLSDGEAAGLFELANWIYYTTIYGACPNYVSMKPISSEQYYTLYLLPSGSQSDNDEIGYLYTMATVPSSSIMIIAPYLIKLSLQMALALPERCSQRQQRPFHFR